MAKKTNKTQFAKNNEWIEEEFSSCTKDAKASQGIKLAPIIQPIAFVPYNTQEQSLFDYGDYDYDRAREDISRGFQDEQAYDGREMPIEKKVRFIPIFIAILSLLIIGVLVAGKFVLQEYLMLVPDMSGYDYIMQIVDTFTSGAALVIKDLIIPGAVALIAFFALINFLASLIKMKSRGACAISKICLFFMLLLSIVLVVMNMINDVTLGYGLYAVAGLSFIALIVGYLAKKDRR